MEFRLAAPIAVAAFCKTAFASWAEAMVASSPNAVKTTTNRLVIFILPRLCNILHALTECKLADAGVTSETVVTLVTGPESNHHGYIHTKSSPARSRSLAPRRNDLRSRTTPRFRFGD